MASTMTISSARETLMSACDFQQTVFFSTTKIRDVLPYFDDYLCTKVYKKDKKEKRQKDKKKRQKDKKDKKKKIKKKVISKKLYLRSYFLKKTKSVYYLVMFFSQKMSVIYIIFINNVQYCKII